MSPTRRRALETAAAAALYLAVSLAVFGRVLADPAGSVVGSYGGDQSFFAWSLAWWPDAIADLRDPLFTDRIYAPLGFNLAWATVIPAPALLAAPITVLAGPLVAYNVLALLALPANATAAFALCRAITGRFAASLAGGYVFGFSSYGLSQTVNHLNLALAFCVPLVALVAVRLVREEIGERRAIAWLAVLFATQFLIFTEMLLTLVLFGGIALAVGLLIARPPLRARLRRVARCATIGGAIAAVAVSPYLYAAFYRPNPLAEGNGPLRYPTDLANLVVPTDVTGLRLGLADRAGELAGNLTEQTAYLGVGLIAILLLVVWRERRGFAGPFLGAMAAIVLVLSLGERLELLGDERFRLPWWLLARVPVVHYALPARFPLYLWLIAAVAVALLLARARRPALAWAGVAGAIALILPSTDPGLWRTPLPLPELAANGLDGAVADGEDALVLPWSFLGPGMRWHMESGFRFRLVGGYAASNVPLAYWRYPIVRSFYGHPLPLDAPGELARFLRDTGTEVVLLDRSARFSWEPILRRSGWAGSETGGVAVYRQVRR